MFGWIKRFFVKEEVVVETEVVKETVVETVAETVPDSALDDSKPKAKKPRKKVTPKSTLEGMTKLELDIFARENLGLNLDRRKTKAIMIEQIQKAEKEK